MSKLIQEIKEGILAGLTRNGYAFVERPLESDALRAIAELVVEGLVRDETDRCGRFVVDITRPGLDRAARLKNRRPSQD